MCDTITINFTDQAGNKGTFTSSVTKSAAGASATLYIDPIPEYDNTLGKVAGMNVRIYGKGVAYEQLILTVGSRSYTINVKGSGAYVNEKTQNWYYDVNLGEIDFPVDVSTEISVRYADLTGGEDSTTLIYNDWCIPVIISTPMADGMSFISGYCEPGTTVEVEYNGIIYNNDSLGFDRNEVTGGMYFFLNLGSKLKEGETIIVRYTDLFENTSEQVFTVGSMETIAAQPTIAEAMGASIADRFQNADGDWEAEQHFAVPVDIEDLKALYEDGDNATNAELKVPVLAYGGYNVGSMNIMYNDGKLYLAYEIDGESCTFDGDYILQIFSAKPTIEEIRFAMEGESLRFEDAIDTAEFGDKLWIYAGFEVSDLGKVLGNPAKYFMQFGDNAVSNGGNTQELQDLFNSFN